MATGMKLVRLVNLWPPFGHIASRFVYVIQFGSERLQKSVLADESASDSYLSSEQMKKSN